VKVTKKLMLAAGALALPLAAVATIGVGSASAARSSTTGTGLVSCTKVTGTIKFAPPLTNATIPSDVATIKATATGCTGGTPTPSKITTSSTITTADATCDGLASAAPPTLTEAFTPVVTGQTLSGGTEAFGITPDLNFTISGMATSASGSYYNSASSTSVYALTSEKYTKFSAACKKKGVKTLKIKSGNVMNL
jgi:hypothetical protein